MPKRTIEDAASLAQQIGAHGLGGVNPDAGQLRQLLASGLDGPLHFLNLLAYYDEARYPEGHDLADEHLSGADAYARYGAIALEQVTRRGGRLTLYNDVLQVVIGKDEPWDQVAIMEYPDIGAFVDMILDPDYVAGLVHRDAGLARTALIVTRPLLASVTS